MSLEAETFDFLERCQTYRAAKPVLDDLRTSAGRFGFEHLILSGVPYTNEALEPLIELNGWPKGWFERYNRRGYAAVDAVCRYCAETTRPFFWHEIPERLRQSSGAKRVAGEAADFGLVSGYVVPVHSRSQRQTVVSLASAFPRLKLSKREQVAINLMATVGASTIEALRAPSKARRSLSRREKEVILWVARGKTAEEVGAILSISAATVRKHLQNARCLFGVSSSSAAVAEALLSRQIVL